MKNEDLDGVFKHVRKIRWSNIVHAFMSSPTVNTQYKFSCDIKCQSNVLAAGTRGYS